MTDYREELEYWRDRMNEAYEELQHCEAIDRVIWETIISDCADKIQVYEAALMSDDEWIDWLFVNLN